MTGSRWTGVDEARARENYGAAQLRLSQRPVALIGFMGVGKTSVGRELARLLDRPFADTDTMVQQRAGASIPELFARGEAVFRALEREAMLEALDGPESVLALGGGAFIQPGTPELLLPRALVVHLYTPWRVMRELLPDLAADRPLIRDRPMHDVQQLFLSRAAAHRRAHVRICLPRRSPQRAAAEIVEVLRQHRLSRV
ncbi:MAG TPA: shikimate kinase [Actinoplanes sp.]|nr:shikimate kinase [Actinoplanes sp.]